MQKCNKCGKQSTEVYFGPPVRRRQRIYPRYSCRPCTAKYERDWRKKTGRTFAFKNCYEHENTPKAQLSPSIRDLEWAAGFLEGEGCFFKKNPGSATVIASQVNHEPLERLRGLFGASIYPHKSGCDAWRAHGARARGIMMTLYTLMSNKRKEQIRKVLLYDRTMAKALG